MKILSRIIIGIFITIDVFLVGKILLSGKNFQILNPQGVIALQERNLILLTVALMLFGAIPLFILAIYVGRKYRASNASATYTPDWDHNNKLQIFFWGFLFLIVSALSVVTWTSAHTLDPHNTIAANAKPMTIQVVALRWKWLFIYPEQGIATVNYVVFPEKTPVRFEITSSDAPMNSFWIPQLGGQIYAMSGMVTQTHLIADRTGQYRGSTAEISGEGFAGMTFSAKSVTQSDFTSWVASIKHSPQTLTHETFQTLSKPSENNPPAFYSSTESNLFTTIVLQYQAHPSKNSEQKVHDQQSMPNMQM